MENVIIALFAIGAICLLLAIMPEALPIVAKLLGQEVTTSLPQRTKQTRLLLGVMGCLFIGLASLKLFPASKMAERPSQTQLNPTATKERIRLL